MKILALDLGKTKTVACDYESDSAEHRFLAIRTSPTDLRALIAKCRPDRVVLEACPAAGWVADLVAAMEVDVQVANTTHPAWRWSNTKRKNDRSDALRLAQLSALNQLPRVHLPGGDVRQWRALIRYRHHLVRRRTQIKNRIRALLEREGLALPDGRRGWAASAMTALKGMAKPIESVGPEELWRGELWVELRALEAAEGFVRQVEAKLDHLAAADERCRLLQTIPGVGPRLAEVAVAVLDDPERFKSAKEVGSYAGLTPRQYQSGESDRRGRISRQGDGLLRAMLVEVGWIGLRHNGWMREVYERVRRGSPARAKLAIVAVARRLLIRCWAILRDKRPWRPPAPALPGRAT